MKVLPTFVFVPLFALSIAGAGLNLQTATAATTSDCVLSVLGAKNTAGNGDSRFTVTADNTVSATVELNGANCTADVVMASWQAPDAQKGLPYSAQKFYKSTTAHLQTTGSNAKASTKLTVQIPDCFYQVDVVPGTQPTDSKGGPQYNEIDGRALMGSLHGGTVACTETLSTPVTPTPTTPATTTPTELPHTGSSLLPMFSTVFGSVLVATAAFRTGLVRRNR